MSEYKYCHGPNCHTYHTVSRIRGVKGNKVLRTRKISVKNWWRTDTYGECWWHYFCDERCRTDYMHKHLQAIMNIEPRSEPLETPIDVVKEVKTYNYGYGDRTYTDTTITER